MAVLIQNLPVDPVAGTTTLAKTYDAVANYAHSIGGVGWSFAADPTTGDLVKVETVDPGPTTRELFRIYVTNKGPGFHPFPKPLTAPRGQNLVVTLVNGGGVAATLNVINWNGPVSS